MVEIHVRVEGGEKGGNAHTGEVCVEGEGEWRVER